MSNNEIGPSATTARVSRRTLLAATGLGAAAAALLTAGQTVPGLAPVALLAPRDPRVGPQGIPVNRTAVQAGVLSTARDEAWRLIVHVGTTRRAFSREDLLALPQARSELPIACVEGWSATASWDGVPLHVLLTAAGAPSGSSLRLTSLERNGSYRVTEMQTSYAVDPLTLIALGIAGEPLDIEHGYPARVIAPGRPGVLQTKWLSEMEVL